MVTKSKGVGRGKGGGGYKPGGGRPRKYPIGYTASGKPKKVKLTPRVSDEDDWDDRPMRTTPQPDAYVLRVEPRTFTPAQPGAGSSARPSIIERIKGKTEKEMRDMVFSELALIAFANIKDVVRWQTNVLRTFVNRDGEEELVISNEITLVASDEMPDEVAAAIAEVSKSPNGSLKVKMIDKRAALVNVANALSMFRPELIAATKEEKVGKKEQLQRDAENAAVGTDWESLTTLN